MACPRLGERDVWDPGREAGGFSAQHLNTAPCSLDTKVEESLRTLRWELHGIRTSSVLGGRLGEYTARAILFRGGMHKLLRAWLSRAYWILEGRMTLDGIDETVRWPVFPLCWSRIAVMMSRPGVQTPTFNPQNVDTWIEYAYAYTMNRRISKH